MTDELAGLPEDVREAVERVELIIGVSGDDLPIIRAELLRLARENAELRATSAQIERENIEGWKQSARWKVIAERAESELAALKRRIAEAPSAVLADGRECVALLPVGGE